VSGLFEADGAVVVGDEILACCRGVGHTVQLQSGLVCERTNELNKYTT
jgi:hypothetical protein